MSKPRFTIDEEAKGGTAPERKEWADIYAIFADAFPDWFTKADRQWIKRNRTKKGE